MSSLENNDANQHPEVIVKIDLEEVFYGRQHHPHNPDPGTVVFYLFKVDKQLFEKREYEWSGKELLGLVGLSPDQYRLFQLGDGHREILPDEKVDLRAFGIERFKSVAKHANEGKEAAQAASSSLARRVFDLPEEDQSYLSRTFENWEVIQEGGSGWLLIHSFKLPSGFNVEEATVAFMVPSSYPSTEFDMMYFWPALSRKDGKEIGALTCQSLDSKTFQRWSRHRIAGAWRPGIDNIETHVLSVLGWLMDEFKKR